MKDVQPIKTKESLEKMQWALKRHCSERDYILFTLGCETGLRVGDLLKLTTKQVIQLKSRKEKVLKVKEGKTDKIRSINIKNCYDEVYTYANQLKSEWLFPSRKGDKAISPTQAYRQLNKAGEWAEITGIGNHTLRKTFGYHFYRATKDVAMLQRILNHSHPEITLRYIGITDEETNDVLNSFSVFK